MRTPTAFCVPLFVLLGVLFGASGAQPAELATSEVAKLTDSAGFVDAYFGWMAAAVSGDTAVVGSDPSDSSLGVACIFERNRGGADSWDLVKRLTTPLATPYDQKFGRAVAIDGDTVAIGGWNYVLVYERNQGGANNWGLVQSITDATSNNLGNKVGLSGSTLVASAPNEGGTTGAVFVYERNQGGADNWGLVKQIDRPGTLYAYFGIRLAFNNDTLLAGFSSGSNVVYLFERNQGGSENWGQVATLVPSDANAYSFGVGLAVEGDMAVVGDPSATTAVGSAYVYERNQGGVNAWGEVTRLTASDGGVDDHFGWSAGVANDTIVVGAIGDSLNKIYIFRRNHGGADAWGEVESTRAADTVTGFGVSDKFGSALSIDGGTIVVGAYSDDDLGDLAGTAFIFERTGTTWDEDTEITSHATGSNGDGMKVAQSGDMLVVGVPFYDAAGMQRSGAVYVFERNWGGSAENWGLVTMLEASDKAAGDDFGNAVAVEGDTIVVGSRYDDDAGSSSGSAYVFTRNQGGADNWGQAKKLVASDAAIYDAFGVSVSIDVDRILVGATGKSSNEGAAYLFERNYDPAAPSTPSAENWGQRKKLTGASGANLKFGLGVVSGDTVLIGAYGEGSLTGAAYVFERNQGGADNWGQVKRLTASDAATDDYFGGSVSLDNDTAAVAAWYKSGGGAVYVFERNYDPAAPGTPSAENWGEVEKIVASDAASNDSFGLALAIRWDKLLVGAYRDDDGGTDSGSAYLFERNDGGAESWGEIAKVVAADATMGDGFGYSVDLGHDMAAIVSVWDDDGASNGGSVYIFRWNAVTLDADLGITKDDGVTEANPGGSVTYTIQVSNAGPDAVTGAAVTDTFSSDLTCSWTCVAGSGAACTAGPVAGNITDSVDLASGSLVTYTAVCSIDGAASGSLVNTAAVAPPTGVTDANPSNNSATDTDTLVVPQADLSITKDDGAGEATIGGSVVYAITATNAGPDAANGATVADAFPADLTCSWTCDADGGASCTPGPVAGDISDTVNLPTSGEVTYTAVCDIDGAASGTLENTATVAAPALVTDPNLSDNSATDTDTLVADPPETLDLDGMTMVGAQTFEAGRTITVTDFVVEAPGGNVTFRAGESVIFGDGFVVEAGCEVTVEIDPTLIP